LPLECLERTLLGDREIAKLCKLLGFTPNDTVNMIVSFTLFKFSHHILKYPIIGIAVCPISTADCQRGFGAMNLQHTG